MGRKIPTEWPRDVKLLLWTIAIFAWLVMGLGFATTRGCDEWRNWNANEPLPEVGPLVVRRLEEYKVRHGHYPADLRRVGLVDGLPEKRTFYHLVGGTDAHYHLIEGTDAQEFYLSIDVTRHRGMEFDYAWRYESQKGRWVYKSIYQGGG